jgi:hypothetical protein
MLRLIKTKPAALARAAARLFSKAGKKKIGANFVFILFLYRPRSGDKALDKSPRPVNYFLKENSLLILKTNKKKLHKYLFIYIYNYIKINEHL